MADEKVERWRKDDPDAKDVLLQHDFDRCLADLSYRRANAAWFEQAKSEKQAREREAAAEARRLEAREAFANRHDRAAVEYEGRAKAKAEAEEARAAEVLERLKRSATL